MCIIGKEADLGLRHHPRLADASFYICIFAAWFRFRAWRQGEETPFAIDSDFSFFFSESGQHMRGSSCTVHIWGRDKRRVEDNGIHFPDSNHADGQAHVIPAEPQCRASDPPSAPGSGIRRTAYELRVLSFRGPPAQDSVAKRGGGRRGCG